MAAAQTHTTKDASSQPIMKLQITNYQGEADVALYPDERKMVIIALQHSGLSTAIFKSFDVPMPWLSMAGSTATYSNSMDFVTFNLVNDKKVRLTKKLFTQILEIPNSSPFYKVSNGQIIHMFNEMGHQPALTKISDFKKSGLPCIWNFLFGLYLRCLTGQSVGLDKRRLEVYAMVAGIYYDLNVDYA
ncbi:hypothetical protein Lser_V15G03372 [Lactuca serriola]